jgi:2-dehydro-3-deoxy-D-arabinonate dehydratase
MQYYKLQQQGASRLVAVRDSTGYDLTASDQSIDSFGALVRTADGTAVSPDDLAEQHLGQADRVDRETIRDNWCRPLAVDEVWAAGVTYRISEEARTEESTMPQMYIDVYDAERPELFFKASPARTVGPDEAIGVRGDSEWNVPEPELGVVLYEGEIVGYTVGNDVSSREIEGENPLYLPQAKVYDRCCAVGPCVVTDVSDPHDLSLSMRIRRDGEVVYRDETSTAEMVRTCEELVSYYTRHNVVPELSVLLTGTSLVPDESFSLAAGDHVDIEIEDIGVLSNPVVRV